MAVVRVPALMRDLTGGLAAVRADGLTVAQVLDALEAAYPGVRARLMPDGRLSAGLVVAVDGHAGPLGLRTPVHDDSEIRFVPRLGGG